MGKRPRKETNHSIPAKKVKISHPQGEELKWKLFICAGQSNMAGRGALDNYVYQFQGRKVYMLNKKKEWIEAKDPVHFDEPNKIGVGPALSFIEHLISNSVIPGEGEKIGIIPVSVGGSSIQEWKETHFENAFTYIDSALEKGEIQGLLWHQGETDASILDKNHHQKYRSMLLQILQKFRDRLGKPNLPIICGEIANFVSSCTKRPFPYVSEINSIIREVCQHELHHSECVLVDDVFQHIGDSLHFDSASARLLGKQYAEAFERACSETEDKV